MHNMRNQSKRRRVEEEENSVESVMSTAPGNHRLQFHRDPHYFPYVDQMLRDVRYDSEWRNSGPMRYYQEQFWEAVTGAFNRRVQADALPPLTMQQLIDSMNSRRRLYYQMRAANSYTGNIGDAFRLCDDCSHIAIFPRKFCQQTSIGSDFNSASVSGEGSGSGHQPRERVRQRDDYGATICELYTQGVINDQVYVNALFAPQELKSNYEVMERDQLIRALLALSDFNARR